MFLIDILKDFEILLSAKYNWSESEAILVGKLYKYIITNHWKKECRIICVSICCFCFIYDFFEILY